jgi:hypothetical protein
VPAHPIPSRNPSLRVRFARLASLALAAAVSAVGGCGAALIVISDPTQLPRSGGRPHIERISDLGTSRDPVGGDSLELGRGNGFATTGELVLIQGQNLGRLPAVTIGGRPARVAGRTTDGSIIAQLPWGVAIGQAQVLVQSERGTGRGLLPVRRLALVSEVQNGRIHVLELDGGAVHKQATLDLPSARSLALAAQGGVLYVAPARGTPQARIDIVDLSRNPQPVVVRQLEVGDAPFVGVATSTENPRAVVVTRRTLRLYDLRHPTDPVPHREWALPLALAKADIRDVRMSPDGKQVALLARGNLLFMVHAESADEPRLSGQLPLLPAQGGEQVRDLQFSADGQVLWALAGGVGGGAGTPLPTQLLQVMPGSGSGGVQVAKIVPLPDVPPPLRLAVARGLLTAQGTTVQVNVGEAPLVVAGLQAVLARPSGLDLGSPADLALLKKVIADGEKGAAQIVRIDAQGGPGSTRTVSFIPSALGLSSDAQVLLAAGIGLSQSGAPELVLSLQRVYGGDEKRFPLAPLVARKLAAPYHLGEVIIQP